ncbi:hypothetical protein [Halorubrum coriense]|uniref:hypothetical protein n=1 Tax=Halorubrum coriense TaxID=64713 RepID=UPI000678173B|nr:hypothetical protein [Halorubrum coriense]
MGDETEADRPSATAIQRAARTSRLGQLWRRTITLFKGSYLYRWLTAEPDPDVIVIDLRETWTVGPFIRLLDAVIERVLPAFEDSRAASAVQVGVQRTLAAPLVVGGVMLLVGGLLTALTSVATQNVSTIRLGIAAGLIVGGAVATRERRTWAELRETRPVELLIAALEPPEPPAQNDTQNTHTEDESSAAPTNTTDAADDQSHHR